MKLSDYFQRRDALTKRQLAEKLGVSVQYIYMLEKGERRPSPEMARRLEAVTGIPLERLLFPETEVA